MMKKYILIISVLLAILLLVFYKQGSYKEFTDGSNIKPSTNKVVKFAMLPYGDHTQAIIGIKNGWFKDVGIEIEYKSIRPEQVVTFLSNGSYDVISTSPGLILAGWSDHKDLGMFSFHSLFQGFAIMAQPSGNYKSVDELIGEGMTEREAIKAAIVQMRGKRFAYPTEGGVKPFVDLVLDIAQLDISELTPVVNSDTQNVSAMRNRQSDFQVGGAPSRVTLEQEGFKPILSAVDLVKAAIPSSSSKELAAVFPDGWSTSREYFEKNKATIYRLAGVSYRIVEFMNENQEAALDIHMPYLSRVTGETFSNTSGKVIYDSLDPFVTFKNQHSWFFDNTNPLYYQHVIGAHIESYIDSGLYKGTSRLPSVDDVIWADDVYSDLLKFREKAIETRKYIDVNNVSLNEEQRYLLNLLDENLEKFNFYDASKVAEQLDSIR